MQPRNPRGRGATTSPPPRYLPTHTVPFDDGWGDGDGDDDAPPPLATTVTPEASRTILTRNRSPDVPFSVSINPYKGCEHGCIYCYARPTHAYLDLSPGLDFESRLFSKPDGPALLRQALRRRGHRVEPIAIGANTDPYQPVERELRITRGLLEVLAEFRHPASLITRSNLVLRDVDLLADLARDRLVAVYVSITTLDRALARRMEPRAPTPQRRLDAVRGLADAGVPVGVMAAPMIPGLNDAELEAILEAAAAAGARTAGYTLVRLPLELAELFEGWLDHHYPLRKKKILDLIRDARGGRLYTAAWGTRMRGTGAYAALLDRRFQLAQARLGLDRSLGPLATDRFRIPPETGAQLSLFPDR